MLNREMRFGAENPQRRSRSAIATMQYAPYACGDWWCEYSTRSGVDPDRDDRRRRGRRVIL